MKVNKAKAKVFVRKAALLPNCRIGVVSQQIRSTYNVNSHLFVRNITSQLTNEMIKPSSRKSAFLGCVAHLNAFTNQSREFRPSAWPERLRAWHTGTPIRRSRNSDTASVCKNLRTSAAMWREGHSKRCSGCHPRHESDRPLGGLSSSTFCEYSTVPRYSAASRC